MGSIAVCFSNSANLSISLDVHIQVLFQLQYFCCTETLRCIDQELNPSQQLRKQPRCGGLTLANCQGAQPAWSVPPPPPQDVGRK